MATLADRQGQHEDAVSTYDADGVDLTLIRWSLSLTPVERLRYLEGQMRFFRRMREARRG